MNTEAREVTLDVGDTQSDSDGEREQNGKLRVPARVKNAQKLARFAQQEPGVYRGLTRLSQEQCETVKWITMTFTQAELPSNLAKG
jgi:hypothetical protein